MKSLESYIFEAGIDGDFLPNLNNTIFKDVDIYGYKYPYGGISDISPYREKVTEFVNKYYNKNIVQLWYDTYVTYLQVSDHNPRTIEKILKHDNKILQQWGFGQIEYSCLESGWWYFISYLCDQIKK